MTRQRRSAILLAALMGGAGVLHFAVPKAFDSTVPRMLPGKPRTWTYASGVVEIALAAGLAHPQTRMAAARATTGFFIGVFPANVQMAVDWRHRPRPQRVAACARLPLQVPLVLWARGVARGADGP
ncbi:DoxX family protein [Streptomyces sp. NPDC091287]|uniref:DoxX family protein n=1 Tax=Streptomyces sp. NPDC091287 TaxID=3365988 RepID=UPI00380FF597